MNLVYLGSPEASVAPLRALHAVGHDIVLVVTGADKRRGRGGSTTPTPVKAAALELGLTVTHELGDVLEVPADLGVVVAYGRIIPAAMLDHVRMINLHFSLLPRWRGAAPVERAILAGDESTGVCVMDVAVGLDTGGVHACEEVLIGAEETAAELRERLTLLGAELLVRTLAVGLGAATPQDDSAATYAEKIRSVDRMITSALTAEQFLRVVRIGGAWTEFRGKRLKILQARRADAPTDLETATSEAVARRVVVPGSFIGDNLLATGDGVVELLRVQPEGKAAMAALDWARGARPAGERIDT